MQSIAVLTFSVDEVTNLKHRLLEMDALSEVNSIHLDMLSPDQLQQLIANRVD